ncbi:LytR/AlgR family response regulator transcription factor [Streptococcus pseudoporcinus]|uniref:Sensory transduction protein LytT n=1 Tax=Streptococcus pseudoporcinus LQ 940-04 TaxID=875093 RepID=G5K966_9STRE|nr:LytTR family transcriptional regulator DNA-binding domain-containing protein [Streptococcus pseudoporcinus]EFR44423.1 LytTr DNA-binding domain protein [Streptococcus pseudoporcinus SPIN 20026]EHI64397.1 sensory transduction protein LytT [Streptococcus pseudoporcinus LQ 940-04]VEF93541.1 two-component response regulator [Streptococcus pseudoporcinus]
MKVALIDDEPLARMELSYLLQQTQEVEAIFEGESIEDAFQIILTDQPDLLFLDIHLTDESGLDLAKRLSKVPQAPLIIFATAYDNHAVEAFEVNALDYILKPFEETRIKKAIEKAKSALEVQNTNYLTQAKTDKTIERLTIETDERIYLLPFTDIIYCEVQGKETTIHTKKGSYTSHTSLSALEKNLTSDRFLKVHRAYIINQEEIKEIQPWFNQTYQVTMSNRGKVPVSRSYIKSFKQQLGL